jgi:UDP-glucose 4-epimerase
MAEAVQGQRILRRALDGVDGCFHLSAIASVERCHDDWLRSHTVNLGGTITVFEEVLRAQTRRGRPLPVVYASSAAVYGNAGEIPIPEAAKTRPTSAYGVDKLGCELHAAVAGRVHDLAAVGLRFFNVYGPRQDPNSPYSGVISIFCRQILRGALLEIHGDGRQIRDFVFVDDAVAALRCAIEAAGPAPQIFNVCTGVGTSIGQLGEIIAQLCDGPFRPRYVPSRVGDLPLSIGDPGQASDKLCFAAATPLHQGLALTIASMMTRARRGAVADRLLLAAGN